MFDKKILEEIEQYIQQHLYILEYNTYSPSDEESFVLEEIKSNEIEEFIQLNRKPTLKQVLFKFIDEQGVTDAYVYKKAGIDRKHFSKIRSNPKYRPGKNTIIALGFALELSKEEMDTLLNAAGYSLSQSNTSDLVVQFFLEKEIYDLDYVNQALNYFSLKPLSSIL